MERLSLVGPQQQHSGPYYLLETFYGEFALKFCHILEGSLEYTTLHERQRYKCFGKYLI